MSLFASKTSGHLLPSPYSCLAIFERLSPDLTSWILVAVELEPLLTFEKSGMSLIGAHLSGRKVRICFAARAFAVGCERPARARNNSSVGLAQRWQVSAA